jgi:mono/diheme cytochrome c family protein
VPPTLLRGQHFDKTGGRDENLFAEREPGGSLGASPDMRRFRLLCLILNGVGMFAATAADPRPLVKNWAVEDFDAVIFVALEGYRDFENGRRLFSKATCVKCHRFADEGPAGSVAPDLSKAGETVTPRDLLEAILAPSASLEETHEVHHLDRQNAAGLLDSYREEDILDLLAYLLSGGKEKDPMFRK